MTGIVAVVTPDGSVRQVADDVAFPNGMAVTPDNATLFLAESYANQRMTFDISLDGSLSNRRVWAETGDDHPDGIYLDAEGGVSPLKSLYDLVSTRSSSPRRHSHLRSTSK